MPGVPFSRYEFADVHVDECGRTFLDVPTPISRRVDSDDQKLVVGTGDTVRSLAWRFYKDLRDRQLEQQIEVRPSSFFWAVAQFNDVVDATDPLPIGETFRAPSIQRLLGEITVPPAFYSRNESI